MAPDFENLQDLITAENPLEWAWGNLQFEAQGDRSAVFSHPNHQQSVVRVSDYPDSWFAYADHLIRTTETIAKKPALFASIMRHGPRAHAISAGGGYYCAVCERLTLVTDDDAEAKRWVATAQALVSGDDVDAAALARFRSAQPRFEDFIQFLPIGLYDVKEENWMLRRRHLVLNDPCGFPMRPEEEALLTQRWGRSLTPATAGP